MREGAGSCRILGVMAQGWGSREPWSDLCFRKSCGRLGYGRGLSSGRQRDGTGDRLETLEGK